MRVEFLFFMLSIGFLVSETFLCCFLGTKQFVFVVVSGAFVSEVRFWVN